MSDHVDAIRVGIDEVTGALSDYLRRVEAGATVVILKAGKPLAEIKPIVSTASGLRPFGMCAGEFIVPDDFDAPLPENILREFEGK